MAASSSGSSTPQVHHRHTASVSSLKKHLRGKSTGRSIGSDSELPDQEAEALVLVNTDWQSVDWSMMQALPEPKWHHVFVIPNFKEDMDTLTATLDCLSRHPYASTYTVVLAMEAKEVGASRKALHLQKQYGGSFQSVVYTLHELAPKEMPGKASNVNAAVRHFYQMCAVDRSSTMLTIVDADALVPFLYIQQLEAVSSAQSDPTGNVYAGPVLFEQDTTGVPAMVRVTDYMWSGMALQNLNNWTGIGFPISNYSIPLALAHEIGFWDVWPDAIGEDMHMFIKAFFMTGGKARLLPLHIPINMRHVSGDNYVKGLYARFLQAERHMRGIADTAYVLSIFPNARGSWRSFILLIACLEAHLFPVITLTALVLLPVYYNFMVIVTTGHIHQGPLPLELEVLSRLGQVNLAFCIVVLACYEHYRYVARRYVYRDPSYEKVRRCWMWVPMYILGLLNYLLLFVGVWFYSVLPALLVIAKHALGIKSMNYIVADKGMKGMRC